MNKIFRALGFLQILPVSIFQLATNLTYLIQAVIPPPRGLLILLTVFAFNIFALASAYATDYYVATNGSDSNPGTQAAPWATMKKAFASVKGGETVYFRAGTYAAATIKNVNPPANQWITFKPYSGETVTIDTKTVGNYIGSLIIVDSSYLVFDGFHITSSNFNPAIFNCKLKYIDNNNGDPCYDAWGGDHHVGIQLNPSDQAGVSTLVHHLVFQNNEIYRNMGHGIMGAANDVKFLNNHIHHNGRYATYVDGDNWIMRGNELDHNWGDGFRVGNTNDTGQGPANRFWGVNFLIEQNYVHDALGPQVGPGGKIFDSIDAAFWGMSGGIIRNNIFANGEGGGVICANRGGGETHFYNNTIYGHPGYGLDIKGNCIATNNIIYNSGAGNSNVNKNDALIIESGGSAKKNIIGGVGVSLLIANNGQESGNITNVDPKLSNPSGGDFSLAAGSPATDAGLALSDVPNDYVGGARPFGAAYDIGAYENGAPPGSGGPPTDVFLGPDPGMGSTGTTGSGAGGTGTGVSGGLSNCAR